MKRILDERSATGVLWVITYGLLVLVVCGQLVEGGYKPPFIVLAAILVLPFLAHVPVWILKRIRRRACE